MAGNTAVMAFVYVVQHAQKRPEPLDPDLTDLGMRQAARTGRWLGGFGLRAVYSSPMRRAWRTAEPIAEPHELKVRRDDRLRERMNWDGVQPLEDFMADWARCVEDRSFVPRAGDSSRLAGCRMAAFLRELADRPGSVAVVSHGGVTVDLLRTLLGDDALPAALLHEGVPSCAITTFNGLTVVDIARTDHLD